MLTREGEVGREFLIIIEGQATVTIEDRTVVTLGAGEFFGEIALLDGAPRTATVTADTDLLTEVMNHREFDTALAYAPNLTRSILKGVATHLRAADAHLVCG